VDPGRTAEARLSGSSSGTTPDANGRVARRAARG
jgi:hypothetical protein